MAKIRLTNHLHSNFSVGLPYFWTITVIIVKLTEYVLSRTGNISVSLRLTPRLRRDMRLAVIFSVYFRAD